MVRSSVKRRLASLIKSINYASESSSSYLSPFIAIVLFLILLVNRRHRSPTQNHEQQHYNESWQLRIPSVLYQPEIHGGTIYQIPAGWNRFHSPWMKRPTVHFRNPIQSRHRYLYSVTRIGTSDGLGHSMGVINYELNIALQFNLTYTHRVGRYSSLTRKDPMAVEDFFGWGDNEVPRRLIQEQGCIPMNGTWPESKDIYSCHVCQAPKVNGSLAIKHLVHIPVELETMCRYIHSKCKQKTIHFLNSYSNSHTVFQLSQSKCGPPVTQSTMLDTKDFFYHKYWKKHGQLPWDQQAQHSSINTLHRRPIRLDTNELHIAVHVRRGDFLQKRNRGKRKITHDQTFATVISRIVTSIGKLGGVFSRLPVTIHIYSEGNLVRSKVLSTHSVDVQDKTYYDSHGTPRNESWWKDIILQKVVNESNSNRVNIIPNLDVRLHISEETILSLHEMISADVFVGSVSGMSSNLVWSLARGVVLIPHTGSIDNERGKRGSICCSIPFDNDSGYFSKRLFEAYWIAYSRANKRSLES